MLHDLIAHSPRSAEAIALAAPTAHANWNQLRELTETFVDRLHPVTGQRVGFLTRASVSGIAVLAALDHLGADVFLLPSHTQTEPLERIAADLEISDIVSSDVQPAPEIRSIGPRRAPGGMGSVTILTSGTSGKPKAARHTWSSLARPAKRLRGDLRRHWLLSFRPHLYAGLQVILQCFVNYDTLVTLADSASPTEVAQTLRDKMVTHCSGTPSFWRRLLLFADRDVLAQAPLQQITIGGEVADQPLLDGLRSLYPAARLAHIYATTELGRCFSVNDGRAGFPRQWLQQCPFEGIELNILDGELRVRSKNRMLGYDPLAVPDEVRSVPCGSNEWTCTGDQVEVDGDRVYFIGRATDLINVGGNKVAPLEVESIVRRVDGVTDARVYGHTSSIAGQIVACDVVRDPQADENSVRQAIGKTCRALLSAHQVPRIVRFVEQIELTAAGKMRRG